MPYGRMSYEERKAQGYCTNTVVPAGMRFPVECNRKVKPGSELCGVCAAAKERGKRRSQVAGEKYLVDARRRYALTEARNVVIEKAKAVANCSLVDNACEHMRELSLAVKTLEEAERS